MGEKEAYLNKSSNSLHPISFITKCDIYDQNRLMRYAKECERILERSSNFAVRRSAIDRLGTLANALNITPKNAGVMIDILKRACDDEHYTVRGCAAKALGNLRYTNSTVIRLLRSMLEDPDDFVKITAKNALEKLYVE